MRPRDEIEPLTPEQEAELAELLAPERPQPTPSFRARLDAHVEDRFTRDWEPSASAPPVRRRRRLRLPVLPALATTCAVGVVAIAIAVGQGGSGTSDNFSSSGGSVASDTAAPSGGSAGAPESAPPATAEEPESAAAVPERAASDADGAGTAAPAPSTVAPPADGGRKVERSSVMELGTPADKVDDVAQDVLDVVTRHGGIVDQSSVATRGEDGEARFELRIPAARLTAALGQLSRLPDAQVLARTDDALDVNQAYVSVRRQLTGAEAQRRGLLRALANADSEDETERLRSRLDEIERTIAVLERNQRALDRRVDHSRVELTVRAHEAPADEEGAAFTPGRAFDDAGRVLAVTAGVVVIAAAALVPLALLAALAWPLARALRRHRREQALDATA